MDKQTLGEIKNLIDSKILSLIGRTESTVDKMSSNEAKYPDPSDRGTMESDRTLELRIRDRERKLIIKLKRAAERIERGTYGFCTNCGESIGEDRLRARPEAELCIECKEEMELREKRVKQIGTRMVNS